MFDKGLDGEQIKMPDDIMFPEYTSSSVMRRLAEESEKEAKLLKQIRINRIGRGSGKSWVPTYILEARRKDK